MSEVVNILVSLVLFFFVYCFFPIRIYLKFKKAGVKGAFKHNLRIALSHILFLFFAIFSQFLASNGIIGPNAASLMSLPASACLVFAVFFIIKGMKAGNAAIREALPAVSVVQPLSGAAVPPETSGEIPGMKCPHCGAYEFRPLGAKGFRGRTVANIFLGWLLIRLFEGNIGNTVVYKCGRCKKKWTALPAPAAGAERLDQPCEINVTRPSGFVGAIVPQFVYLNGEKIAKLKNGQGVTFHTPYSENFLFVTDQTGTAFPESRHFTAKSGESLSFAFNRKFLDPPGDPGRVSGGSP
jgi:DNA-directed RNA polymerase subunit RPC12/RpoP